MHLKSFTHSPLCIDSNAYNSPINSIVTPISKIEKCLRGLDFNSDEIFKVVLLYVEYTLVGSAANTFLGRSIYHKVPAILKKSVEYHYPNAQQPGKDFGSTYIPVMAKYRSWPTELNFCCG